MAAGLGLLGLAPAVFWAMTLHELRAAIDGRLGRRMREAPPSRAELGALMRRFPDAG